jgi:hypothetical protein
MIHQKPAAAAIASPRMVPKRHALDRPAEDEAEIHRAGDVDAVQQRLQDEARHRPALAEQQAENGVVDQRKRRGEHADRHIGARGVGDARTGVHQKDAELADRPGQQEQRESRGRRRG